MSQITVKGLTFAYDGSYDNVFENVSLNLDTDWKLGFCGRNGRGKTTFLKLLTGKYEYYGEISASVDFEYFPFEIADMSADTLGIICGFSPEAELWQINRELGKLDVDENVLYRPFETLSNGERTKAMLAALFLRENSFLLIDEPTNHLDTEGREVIEKYLSGKSGFIVVSHDRTFLDSCVDHILSINRADIEVCQGNFTSWYDNKALRDRFEIERNEVLKRDIKRLKATAREKAAWSDRVEGTKIGTHQADRGRVGHLAAKAMKRSKSIETRAERELEEKSRLMKNLEKADSLKLSPLRYHSDLLLYLKDTAISYGGQTVADGISFEVRRGDRIALRGRNGSGKSSVLRLIAGEDVPHTGTVSVGSGLAISYVRQDASGLSGDLSDFAAKYEIDESLFKAILRKLDFQRVQFEKDMRDFSAGQLKKVLIAKSLCTEAHLYIWDEPLNYIDVLSRIQLEELILSFCPTLVFVEHDRAFCEKIATGTVSLS